MRMTWRSVGLLGLLCLAQGCASQRGAQQAEGGGRMEETLECGLRVPAQVRAGEAVPVHFRLTNRSGESLAVLTWRTPLEGTFGNDFRVTRDGEELPYQGPMVK